MSPRPWFKQFVENEMAAVAFMSMEEVAAWHYCTLVFFRARGPFENRPRDLSGNCGKDLKRWNRAVAGLVQKGYLEITADNKITSPRLEAQLSREATEAEAFARGGRARHQKVQQVPPEVPHETPSEVPPEVPHEVGLICNVINELPANRLAGTAQVTYSEDREERVLPTEVPAAPALPAKPAQLNFLPPPQPKPLSPYKALAQEAFPILAWAMGKDLDVKADVMAVGKELNVLRKHAGGDDVALLDIFRRLPRSGPEDQFTALGWLTTGAKRAGITVVAQNDPNDGFGVRAWCMALEQQGKAQPTPPEERANGQWLAHGFYIDKVAPRFCRAARLPFTWRGDLTPILEWMSVRKDILEMERVIRRRAEMPGYTPGSLRVFNNELMHGRAAA